MSNMFSSAFTLGDFMSGDVAVKGGSFYKLGEYVVKAGQLVTVGNGNIQTMSDAIGRIYARFADTTASPGAEIKGTMRLSIQSAQDQPIEIIREYRTELLNTNSSDRTKQLPLPMYSAFVSRDKKIVVEFKADSDATVSKANSSLLMDATIQNI